MSKTTYVLDTRKSMDDMFQDIDFNPQFSYFRAGEKRKVDLEWRNIDYFIKEKQILRGVTGRVDGGEVTALMGSSGAGKSSLMNVLAGRVVTSGKKRVSGDIFVNGVKMEPKEYRRRVAYVMQDDLLFATATVKESLDFSARLRLPPEIANDVAQREQIVTDLVESLGLTHVQDSIVGSVMLRGISGGERKRVAIGIELVTNPTMLFLDEPTSGLDSFNAWKVVKILQNLGKTTGCCCLCTIHQPSSEVFNEFENVLVLSQGAVMYNGLVPDLPQIMSKLGRPIPGLTNPADYIMLVAQTVPDDELMRFNLFTGESKPHINWAYQTSQFFDNENAKKLVDLEDVADLKKESFENSSFLKQVSLLTKREARALVRDTSIFKTAIATRVVMNLVVGAIFFNVCDRDREDFSVAVAFSAVLFAYIGLFMGSLQPQLLNFPLERGIMLREYQTGTYGSAAYLFSKVVVDTPKLFIEVLIGMCVTYPMMGMEGNFVLIVLLGTLTGICSAGLGQVIGGAVSNAKAAQEYSPVLLFPQMLFSGLFIPIGNIPEWLQWMQYISIIKYAATVGGIIEFQDCDFDDIDELAGELATCNASSDSCSILQEEFDFQNDCIVSLETQNVNEDDVPLYLALIVVLAVAFRLLSLMILVYRANFFTD
eukprot:maker-scaffold_5-snap-gene-1.57-mRNA-1 protein AED:0.26 eAED:0.26 QI:181/1/1/1/1/1/2/123/652